MAGDWIKMRGNLWDDPRVTKLVDITDSSEAAVIGALYWLWATADQHSEDGLMPGLSTRGIDRKTGVQGLGEALVSINWIADHPEGIRILRFEDHNGSSAKARLMTAKRVAEHKANAKVTVTPLAEQSSDVSEPLPRDREELEKELTTKTKSKAESATATRLPADWMPSYEDARFCDAERKDLKIDETASRFRDYWIAQPGAKGRKTDWSATWRNWVRNERIPQARASPTRPEKFDPLTHMKNQREAKAKNERTIEFDAVGEPI